MYIYCNNYNNLIRPQQSALVRFADLVVCQDSATYERKDEYMIFTARSSYASVVLGIVILSVCPSICHTRAL